MSQSVREQPPSCLMLGILTTSYAKFASPLSETWGKQRHIKKPGVECKVFIYISSAQLQLLIQRALQYKIKWNTDALDGAEWSDMRL